jgi:hypothetical protein
MIENLKLPMAFLPYEIRLKNAIGKFDKAIVLKLLKIITVSNLPMAFFNLISYGKNGMGSFRL